jgi:hypothetical protein
MYANNIGKRRSDVMLAPMKLASFPYARPPGLGEAVAVAQQNPEDFSHSAGVLP